MPLKGKRQVSKIRKLAEVVGSNPTRSTFSCCTTTVLVWACFRKLSDKTCRMLIVSKSENTLVPTTPSELGEDSFMGDDIIWAAAAGIVVVIIVVVNSRSGGSMRAATAMAAAMLTVVVVFFLFLFFNYHRPSHPITCLVVEASRLCERMTKCIAWF